MPFESKWSQHKQIIFPCSNIYSKENIKQMHCQLSCIPMGVLLVILRKYGIRAGTANLKCCGRISPDTDLLHFKCWTAPIISLSVIGELKIIFCKLSKSVSPISVLLFSLSLFNFSSLTENSVLKCLYHSSMLSVSYGLFLLEVKN